MTEPTPEALFQHYRRDGDPESLATLFDRTAPEVYRLACYLTGNRSEAEDLLQGTFLVAIERASTFRTGARVVPWLLGILANKARRLRERERRRQLQHVESDPRGTLEQEFVAPAGEGPVAAAEGRELRARLEQELDRLTPTLRPVLVLHLQHGVGAAEIATILDRPAGTVRSQICRGMEVLRQALPPGLAGLGLAFVLPAAIPAQSLARIRDVVLSRAARAALPATVAKVSVTGLLALFLNSKVALSTLAAGLAAVAVFAWGPFQLGAEDGPSSGASGVEALAGSAGRDGEVGDAESSTGVVAAVGDREVVANSALPAGEGVLVQIVRDDNGEPVAGAEILHAGPDFVWTNYPPANESILAKQDASGAEALRRHGMVVTTDARGLARMPFHLVQMWTCYVQKDDLYGYFEVARPEDPDVPQVVAITRDRSMEVRVVDEAGQPLPGVPVGIRLKQDGYVGYLGLSKPPDGRLHLDHMQMMRVPRNAAGRRQFWITPYYVGTVAGGVAVDFDELPREPITMRYPSTGRVEVQLLDWQGRPRRTKDSGAVQPLGICLRTPACRPGDRDATAYADEAGRCVVPFVRLGQQLHIDVNCGDPMNHRFQGPVRPGQTVRVKLTEPRPETTLVGQLLYPSREPAAGRCFQVACRGSCRQSIRTDAEGRFRIGLRDAPWDDSEAHEVVCQFMERPARGTPGEHHVLRLRIPQPRVTDGLRATERETATEPAVLQLGALVLEPSPVLVAGRVTGARRWDRPHVNVQPQRLRDPLLPWMEPVTLYREDGRFEVRSFPEQAERVLVVGYDGHIRQSIPFVPGTRNLEIELVPAASFELHARFVKSAAADCFTVALVPDARTRARIEQLGARHSTTPRHLHSSEAGAGFAWWTLVPGTYRLACFCRGWPGPILQIEALDVQGGTDAKPQVQEVDLSDLARPVTLTVLDAKGEPVHGVARVWSPERSTRAMPTPWIDAGKLQLALPGPSADILLQAHGGRAQVVRQVTADRTVRLRPAIEVRIRLPESLAVTEPGARLELVPVIDPGSTPFAGRAGSWRTVPWHTIRPAKRTAPDEFLLTLPTSATYALTLSRRAMRGNKREVLMVRPAKVRVEDREGQAFEISVVK